MGLYSNLPYSDFNNLNLDWIIEKVKEYIDKVDILEINFNDLKNYVTNYFDNLDVQEEINNKLDEMALDGTLTSIISEYLTTMSLLAFDTINDMVNGSEFVDGVIAMCLGENVYNDGKTHLYKIRTLLNTDVVDGVNIIALANFPTLIAELITEPVKEAYTISPIYFGEHITDLSEYPSCVLKVNNLLYLFSFISNSDNGNVYVYDTDTNTFVETKTIKMGHCNSVCYDEANNLIYIAPIYSYAGGIEQSINKLYVYDDALTYIEDITTPEVITAISYDSVTQTIYAYSNVTNKLYTLDNYIFTLSRTLVLPKLNFISNLATYNNKKYNQDIAVNDNIIYISTPYSNIVSFNLSTNAQEKTIVLTSTDVDMRYYMGELEGMEFIDGHLMAVRYTTITNNANYAFIVELPVIEAYASPIPQRTAVNVSLTLSSTTQNTLCLPPWQIKSLLALQLKVYKGYYRVNIDGSVLDDYVIDLNDDIAIIFNANSVYTCKYLRLISANVTLQGTGELITSAPRNNTDSIVVEQGVQLYFAVSSLRVRPANTDFIIYNPVYAPQITYKANIVNNAGGGVYIGSTSLTKGFWVGEDKIASLT